MGRDRVRFVAAVLATARARAAQEPVEDRPLVLAAHLLAACEVLDLRARDLRNGAPSDPMSSLLHGTDGLPEDQLLAHLLAIDPLVGSGPLGRGEVALTPVSAGGFAIAGTVAHAPRGATMLRARRDSSDHPIAWDRPVQLLRHVHLWWNRHDSPVDVRLLPAEGEHGRPWALGAHGSLRVLLAPLHGVRPPRLHVRPRGLGWGFHATETPGGRIPTDERERLAAAVVAHRVDLLVLPELSVEPEEVAWLHSLAPWPRAIIAGSWHAARSGHVRNEAPLLDRRGLRGAHAKRGQFALRSGEIDKFATLGGVTVEGGPLPEGCVVDEAFEPGTELLLFDTPLGRASLVICADLLDTGDCLSGLVDRVAPDLLFVVAMSATTDLFRARMDTLAHLGTTTLLVNAAEVAAPPRKGREGALVAAVRLPWRAHRGEHHLEVRKGEEATNCESDAFEWLDGVGLLLDLGAIVRRVG